MNIHKTKFIFIKIMTMVMFASWIEWMARFRRLYKLGFFTFDSARLSRFPKVVGHRILGPGVSGTQVAPSLFLLILHDDRQHVVGVF